MADAPIVHIGQNSPEHVAFKLLEHIMTCERRAWHHNSQNAQAADRKYILDTYAECLDATTGKRYVAPKSS